MPASVQLNVHGEVPRRIFEKLSRQAGYWLSNINREQYNSVTTTGGYACWPVESKNINKIKMILDWYPQVCAYLNTFDHSTQRMRIIHQTKMAQQKMTHTDNDNYVGILWVREVENIRVV